MRHKTLLETQVATSSPPGPFPCQEGQSLPSPIASDCPWLAHLLFSSQRQRGLLLVRWVCFEKSVGSYRRRESLLSTLALSKITPLLKVPLKTLPSALAPATCPVLSPHYTKMYALAAGGLFPCRADAVQLTSYPTLFLWHGVARVTEYRNRQLLQTHTRQKDRNISFIISQFQPSTLQKFCLKQMPSSLPAP